MPIFEYQCKHCGNVIERIELTSKKTKLVCYGCNNFMEKRISGGYFQVNGYNDKNGYSKK